MSIACMLAVSLFSVRFTACSLSACVLSSSQLQSSRSVLLCNNSLTLAGLRQSFRGAKARRCKKGLPDLHWVVAADACICDELEEAPTARRSERSFFPNQRWFKPHEFSLDAMI